MINKITNLTPKRTIFPFVAAGFMALTGCKLYSLKAREYCIDNNKTQAEYEQINITNKTARIDGQAKLDSLIFRDIFNGTQAANDSAAIADFNEISRNRLYNENYEQFLKENDVTIDTYDFVTSKHINKEERQFEADLFLYNRLFEKYNLKTPEITKKLNQAASFLYPYNECIVFDAYKDIDEHELKGQYTFKNNREAFDFAVNALKKLLSERGYERNGNNEWIK